MERTPGALFRTREMVAGERLRYPPRTRRLMGWPGCGSAPGLIRLGMHISFNTSDERAPGFQSFAWYRKRGDNLRSLFQCGGMGERLIPAVLKTVVPERVPGVRIPLPPP